MAVVSVVIPVHNVITYLEKAIASVRAQDYGDIQLIVVNDGSRPQVADAILSLCLRYPGVLLVNQENQGQSLARCTGVAHAVGDYVMFLDADDCMLPGAMTHLVHCLEANPRAIAAYGLKERIDDADRIISQQALPTPEQVVNGDILQALLLGVPLLSNGSVCIRREALQRVVFVHGLEQGEDWVLWCRLAMMGDFVCAGDRVVLHIRKHGGNVSDNVFKDPNRLWRMFDVVYEDEAFIQHVGEELLQEYKRVHARHVHRHFYYGYRERRQLWRARMHKRKHAEFF